MEHNNIDTVEEDFEIIMALYTESTGRTTYPSQMEMIQLCKDLGFSGVDVDYLWEWYMHIVFPAAF